LESTTVWLVTVGVLSLVIAFDLVMAILRKDKETTITESSIWTFVYVSAAIIFGILMPNWVESPTARPEFFAGWLTEYALSVDNIFVFVIILARLKIDSKKQQLVLLLGIIIALLLRGGFIAAGAAIITRFHGAFFNSSNLWNNSRSLHRCYNQYLRPNGIATTLFLTSRIDCPVGFSLLWSFCNSRFYRG